MGEESVADLLDAWWAFAVSYCIFHATHTTLSTFFTTAFGPWLLQRIYPAGLAKFRTLDDNSRRRFPPYILSTLHAVITATSSLYLFAEFGLIRMNSGSVIEAGATGDGIAPAVAGRRILAFSTAYFLHDMITSQPDWLSHPADLIHHIIGLSLTLVCIIRGVNSQIGHHILITECSTLFINARWMLYTLGKDTGALYMTASLGFAVVFFITRILYLPWVTFCLAFGTMYEVLPFKWVVPAAGVLCGLNIFWFTKIVRVLMDMAQGTSHAASVDPMTRPKTGTTGGDEGGEGGRKREGSMAGNTPRPDADADSADENAPLTGPTTTGGAGAGALPVPAPDGKARKLS